MNPKDHLILYVDDERANRIVFEQSFGARFRLKVLASPVAALELMRNQPVAVLLTDQRMPEMSGSELLQQVKLSHPDTVRMVITAYSDLDPILRAVNEGLVARYLIKPWDRMELERLLQWALEAYELGQESSALQLRLLQTERLVTLGSIGGAVSHDLQRPLTNMIVNGERLRHLAAGSPRLVELLQRHGQELSPADRALVDDMAQELPEITAAILRGCGVMGELIKSIKRLVTPPERAGDEERSVNPVPIIRYAISVCWEPTVRAQGQIAYDGPELLPLVRIGSTELTQILINLVANAAEALGRRQVPSGARAVVSATVDEGAVKFVVTDNGPGMSDEVLRKLGTPFFSTRKEGTGLGVAQCRRLVGAAAGDFKVESVEGQGTTVTVRIPTV